MNTLLIVLPILTILMFDLGLTLQIDDFKLFLRRPRPILAGLFGQLILLPAIAFALAVAFRLEPLFFIGLMLIACSPGGSSSNIFSKLANGDVALSVSLTACSSILTLITIPIIMGLTTHYVSFDSDVVVKLPVGKLIMQNLVLMLVPIILGLTLRSFRPALAARLDKVLSRIAFPALILLATIFFVQNRATIGEHIGQLGGTVAALILIGMAGGVIISWITRLNRQEKRTLVIEIGMQNAAQAIAVACSPFIFNSAVIATPAIIYSLMMNLILLPYVALIRNRK